VTGAAADLAALQAILAGATEYFHFISGLPPGDTEAESLIAALPPGWGPDRYRDKHVLLCYDGDTPVACIDLLHGYPDESTVFIGLLVVAPRRRGVGRAAVAHVEGLARAWGATRVRLAVVQTNTPALAFWDALGYRATGERKPHRMGSVVSATALYEKAL
jgi:ribosomal protein S18 acetylase RimI-like enzyme